jgi:hypothetical protein
MGELASAPIEFQTAHDVPQGGVLLALPALLAKGLLLYGPQMYQLPSGFYGIDSIFSELSGGQVHLLQRPVGGRRNCRH